MLSPEIFKYALLTRVASSDVKDLVGRLDILSKNILDA